MEHWNIYHYHTKHHKYVFLIHYLRIYMFTVYWQKGCSAEVLCCVLLVLTLSRLRVGTGLVSM